MSTKALVSRRHILKPILQIPSVEVGLCVFWISSIVQLLLGFLFKGNDIRLEIPITIRDSLSWGLINND